MFRIGEFSRLTQVSVRMLRYYDEKGLLKPAETDRFTGYRLYAAAQIPQLNRIVFLRDAGFGVAEIARLLRTDDEGQILRRYRQKQQDIRHGILAETKKLDMLDMAIRDLATQDNSPLRYDITLRHVPSYSVLSYRRVIADYYAEGAMWKEMAAFAQKNNVSLTGETFSIYHDADYRETDVDVELCAMTRQVGANKAGFVYRKTEDVPQMACTMVHGPFQRIAGAFQAFAGWLAGHAQYQMGATSRQIVHRGPWNEDDPEQYLTEIQIPLLDPAV